MPQPKKTLHFDVSFQTFPMKFFLQLHLHYLYI